MGMEIITWKVDQYLHPIELRLNTEIYEQITKKNKSLVWNQDIDSFIIYANYKYGFKNWKIILEEVQK